MSDLTKIAEILTLQRSRCEREIAMLLLHMRGYEKKIQQIQDQLFTKSDTSFSKPSTAGLIIEAVQFEKWRSLMRKNTLSLEAQIAELLNSLAVKKDILKVLIVKEDLIHSQLTHQRCIARENSLQEEADMRLENWVLSQ